MIKRILGQLHIYILWLLLSTLLWSWIFTLVTDTVPAKKLTLFIDAPAVEDTLLAAALEAELPPGIRMVKVHPFAYAQFSEATVAQADLFLLSAEHLEAFQEALADGSALPGEGVTLNGVCLGVKCRPAENYITYLGGDYVL
ncbi:MAG: hypothetical protein ACSW8F_06885, partial [bacterium]